jgi:predicted dehydrogenase
MRRSCAARCSDGNRAMINAAIVGLGRWGRSLAAAAAGSGDIRFLAAATGTRKNAEDFCRANNIALVDGYEEILGRADIEAIALATPHSQHEAQALAALDAGKHVFVEKPLTLDLDGARRVTAAAAEKGLTLAVGFNRRFHPSVCELRARLRSGRLGKVVAMVAQHTTSTAQFVRPDNWRAAPEEALGGAFTATGVHSLDHMIEFAGRVREVRCVTARHYPGPSDDTTTLMLQFENGASGLIFCSIATATNFNFTLYGSGGLGEISRPDLSRLRFVAASTVAPIGPVRAPPDEIMEFPGFDTLKAELAAFAQAIRQRKPYPVPIDDVLHGMAAFDAVVRSAQSGRIVEVAE